MYMTTTTITNSSTGAYTSIFGYVNPISNLAVPQTTSITVPITTKGDLLTRNASDLTRLPVGINGQLLVADSTTTTGLNYVSTISVNVKASSSGFVILNESDDTITTNILPGGTNNTKTSLTFAQTVNRSINFPDASGDVVLDSATQTLTNKTLTAPTISTITNGGTVTIPSGTDTLVNLNGSQTMYNKTLVNPKITGPLSELYASGYFPIGINAGGIVALISDVTTNSQTQTLTNKTIANTNNTITVGGTAIGSLINQDVRSTASPSFVGLSLATSGGTPSTLNYYEVFQGSITWSGIWASSQTANVTYVRLGNLVHVSFQRALATANTASQISSDAIPSRFRPSATGSNASAYPMFAVWALTNGAGTAAFIQYTTSGTKWTVYESAVKAASGAGWIGSGSSGILDSGFIYWV